MPLFIRKFVVDAVEGAVTGVLLLNLVLPRNTDEAVAQGAILGTALAGALIAAVRRNAVGGFSWMREKFGVPAS